VIEEDESFYLVKVRTDKNHLGTKQAPLAIIPGMVATVDIITGKKTIMDYLLKPVLRAKQRALRER
jgi:adhesin transport system membrane fusion protein